jgi:ferredoxin-like protein FixX
VRIIEDSGSYRAYTNVGTAAETFQRLLEDGVFQAGLHVKCPACTITSRYVAEALARELRCPRCGTSFLLAPNLKDAQWEYQASGFFAHHREHGAIPVALTMLRLEHDIEEKALFLAPSHTLSWDDFTCEADFLALSQRHDGSVVVAVGECKGGNEEIDDDDIAKLKAVSDRVREAGIECYLVFSTTRAAFSEREITAFRNYRTQVEEEWSLDDRMRGWRRPAPILLTWNELRSFDAYTRAVSERLPEPYAHSLREVAANSAALHLDEHEPPIDWGAKELHI